MKKWICFTLTLMLVLSLTACGGPKEEPQEMDISQEELAELQQEVQEEPSETQEDYASMMQRRVKPYVGKWVSLNKGSTVELFPDGTYLYHSLSDDYKMDGHIHSEGEDSFSFCGGMQVREHNGVEYISNYDWSTISAKYVREEEYDQVVEKVTLTMDNFLDYFEQRIVRQAELDDFGEVNEMSFVNGYFLKDEYLDRMHCGDATLRVFYREHEYQVPNPTSPDFQVPELDPAGAPLDHEQEADLRLNYLYGQKEEDPAKIDETKGNVLFPCHADCQFVTEDPLDIDVVDEMEIRNVVGEFYLMGK